MTAFNIVMMHEKKKIDFTKYPLPRIRHHAGPHLYFKPYSKIKIQTYYPDVPGSIHWPDFFANGNPPDYLDIGCGLGKFLIEYSLEIPDKNILGLEIRKPAVEWIKNIIHCEKIPNAGVIWYSIVNGLGFIETGSIQKIFYLFPDPWIKKRHNKRRAFSYEILDEFERVLKSEGLLYIMTDVEDAELYHKKIIEENKKFEYSYIEEKDWNLPVKTNQEEFCRKKNITVRRMICWKKTIF